MLGFEPLGCTRLLFSSLSLPSGGLDTHFCFTWDRRVTAWFQELKHWEEHQTVRADHTGWAGSTKFRSFKILHFYSAARLLTEVKKNEVLCEFQIDSILLNLSINSVALHLPPTIRSKEKE